MTKQILSDRQQQIVSLSPATSSEIAEEIGVTGSTVRDHISNLSNYSHIDVNRRPLKGGSTLYDIRYEGVRRSEEDGVNHKGKKTKLTRKHLMDREAEMNELLERTEPVDFEIPDPTAESEDVCIHRTDDHVGALVENDYGEVIHNIPLVREKFRKITQKEMMYAERQRSAGMELRGAHLLIGGDVVDGERVYSHQPWEVCATLDEQIDVATELYVEEIKTLAENFEFVQVVCQQGNHGDFGDRVSSKDANADRLLYSRLEFIIGESEYDNVTFVRNASNNYTNFTMRGHRGHLRHGQNALSHIGTSSGKNRWRGWKLKHNFDIAYWGHYHSHEVDDIFGAPAIRGGSLNPADDFEEGISEESRSVVTMHGVSDRRPRTWSFPIDLKDY